MVDVLAMIWVKWMTYLQGCGWSHDDEIYLELRDNLHKFTMITQALQIINMNYG